MRKTESAGHIKEAQVLMHSRAESVSVMVFTLKTGRLRPSAQSRRTAEQRDTGIAENGQTVSDIVGSEGLPILVKLLDAGERLAVQVHPTVEFARKHLRLTLRKNRMLVYARMR